MILGIDGRFANYQKRAGIGSYSLGLLRALSAQADSSQRLRFYVDEPPHRHFPSPAPHVEIRLLPRKPGWTQRILSRELRAAPPDVYFSPMTQLPWRCPCPALVAVLDLAFLDFPGEFTASRRWRAVLQSRHAIRHATGLIAISQATADSLRKHFPAISPAQVIYPGFDAAFHPAIPGAAISALRARHGLHNPYLLYVGRIQPRKNLIRLVQAFAAVKQAHPELAHTLLIAGDSGWLAQSTLAEIERHPGMVRRLGHVPDADLPALMAGAEALALVSLWEGFGLPALEAMACGVPVLCSNNSALPEVCGEAAVLVDPCDIRAIADGLYRILSDSGLRERLAQEGPERAAGFSWDAAAEALFALAKL